MRAVVVSHHYADPANRGKLRVLAGLGATVAVAVPDRWVLPGGGVRVTAYGDDAGVRVVPIPVRGSAGEPPRLTWNTKALKRLLTDFRPDLVQVEEEPWTAGAAAASRTAKRLKIPLVIATRDGVPRALSLGERLRRDRVLGRARGILGGSQLATALATRKRNGIPHEVVPQLGITPLPLVPRVPHGTFAIGFVGRLVPERGLDLLFRACVNLVGNWTISVVGTGPSQEELEGLAERLGIAARITWHGGLTRSAVDQVWPLLDCAVFPSRTTPRWVETVGRAALEAMAHGVAVVSSDSGVLPELIGDTGRIVAEENVTALAETLYDLYADPGECQRLGAAGRRRVLEQFADDAVGRKTLDFWTRLSAATI
ncbi:MAG: glycosyltransferase family 4 protein [Gemmatimonadales bacterium]|nr:glycosyltransferase family 4 protein [Gemmatimonadales bacterium]